MSLELVVSLDQGSSSSRALAVDSRGRVVARTQFPVRTFSPRPGWFEHDPLELARSQERALDAVLSRIPRRARVLGLGLACQRSSFVLWDRETGRPAARAPSWRDGRAAGVIVPLQDRQAQAHEVTGLYLTPYYSAPKMRWLLDNSQEARSLLEAGRLMAGPVASFLVWRLTRGEVFAADPSLAQRMMLMSLGTLDWDQAMLSLFQIPSEILPRILPSAGEWGHALRRGRRLPILSVLGDQQAAVIGLGGMEKGSSVANYGTGAFFLHNTGQDQRRIPGLLTSVGWKKGSEACFLQEGTVHAAGGAFDWLRQNLGLLQGPGDIERLCRASRERLLALPAIGGLGAPRWDYVTKTAFFGLTPKTKSADLVRAVAEAIAFLIADIVSALRSGGLSPGLVRASGGLSRVNSLMQFQSDILGLEVRRCRESEATALGAASLAAQAAGAPWAARLREGRSERVFEPSLTPQEAQRRLSDWSLFVSAQARLSREVKSL